MQKMSDPPLKKCPQCGGALAKMISSTSFVLKGTGWYATDYAKKGNGSGNGSGNGKRTDHKDHGDHGKDVDVKKDTSPAEKTAEAKAEKPVEKTAGEGRGEVREVRFGGLVPPIEIR